LLLTDCHMPDMDGFELTAAIRRKEQGQVLRTPIIAITANALKGEAEHCIRSGMDAFLAKPVGLDRLRQALDRWLPADLLAASAAASGPAIATALPTPPPPTPLPAGSPPQDIMDPDALGRILGSADRSLLRTFRLDFLDNGRSTIVEIHAARSKGDATAVAALAHRFKSSSAAVGAIALSRSCQLLERTGRSGDDWREIDGLIQAIEHQLQEVVAWVQAEAPADLPA
jgi:HPt (histidine-containing phosphotransfer) domain-containing protein